MKIKPIRSEADYDDALERIYDLLQLKPEMNSAIGDELDLLATLVEVYEAVHYPMIATNPNQYLKQKMLQLGLKQADMIEFIGEKTQVSKILSGKRDLTLPMIKRLSKGLHIPIERLVGV
jgi:HTH-type transcriptional regulator / antitoxin HigA